LNLKIFPQNTYLKKERQQSSHPNRGWLETHRQRFFEHRVEFARAGEEVFRLFFVLFAFIIRGRFVFVVHDFPSFFFVLEQRKFFSQKEEEKEANFL
jgi:hypothetical protein